MLPPEAVDEFIQIYEKHFETKLRPHEAEEAAMRIYNFLKITIRPREKSTNLAKEVFGQESNAERNIQLYG